MNLFNKIQDEYDQLWKHIIRPTRSSYPQSALGPQTFILQNKKVKRVDFQLINPRGCVFYVSHFIPLQQQNYPCVIYLHGNSSNRTEGMEYLGQLIRRNISLCTFDFSGCGNSEGEFVTLGYYEWQDLHEVVQWIRHKQKVTKLAIWGRSMGAVTALLYLTRSQNICAGVFDSPFKSLKTLVEDLVKKNSKIPMIILAGALKIISGTIQQKAKFDIYKLNPNKYQVPFIKYPGFFIVGKEDQLIPYTHSEQLFKNYLCSQKQIRVVSGGHNDERPESCIIEAINFLQYNLTNNKQSKIQKMPVQIPISKSLSQKKKKQQDIDFFADNIGSNSNPQTKKQSLLDDEDELQYRQFEDKPQIQTIDFFNDAQMQHIDFNLEDKPKKIQQAINSPNKKQKSNAFSFGQLFNNVVSKAKSFAYAQTATKQLNRIADGYDQSRRYLFKVFKGQQSDIQQKNRMKKTNQLAKIKRQQIQYKQISQNQGKVQSWIFK